MTPLLKDFKRFADVIERTRCLSEALAAEASEFLELGFPNTKDAILALHFSSFPKCEEVMSLYADLIPIETISGYEAMKDLAMELLSRMVVVVRSFEDIRGMLVIYGHPADPFQYNQFKALMSTALQHMLYTLDNFQSKYKGTSWYLFSTITNLIFDIEQADTDIRRAAMSKPETSDTDTPACYVDYESIPARLLEAVYKFIRLYPEYELPIGYPYILQQNGIAWRKTDLKDINISVLDDQCILALIIAVAEDKHFADGALARYFHNGCVLRWLKRLEDLDNTPIESERKSTRKKPRVKEAQAILAHRAQVWQMPPDELAEHEKTCQAFEKAFYPWLYNDK